MKALYYGAEPDVRDDFLRWLDETEPAQRTERKNSIVMTTLRSLTDTLTRERLIAARSRCAIVMADLGVELGTAQQWAEAAVKSLDRHSSLNDVIAFKQSLALVLSAQGNHGEALTHLRSIEEL
ncbi:MAG: hypothetical protein ABIK62_02285, partial [candidate division WOR-3 bacterium]